MSSDFLNIRLDRVQVMCAKTPLFKLPDIPGFITVADHFVLPQTSIKTFARVRRLWNENLGVELYCQYEPRCSWLGEIKITAIGDDWRGLQRPELERVLKSFPPYKLILAEIASDFTSTSGIDFFFVQRHGMFGKSQLQDCNEAEKTMRFGKRKSDKLVRIYPKEIIDAFRIEHEFHSRWLRKHGIDRLKDLRRLPDLIFPAHFRFVDLDWNAVEARVSKWRNVTHKSLDEARRRRGPLHRVLTCLRQDWGLTNVHRFLEFMEITDRVSDEFRKWAKKW